MLHSFVSGSEGVRGIVSRRILAVIMDRPQYKKKCKTAHRFGSLKRKSPTPKRKASSTASSADSADVQCVAEMVETPQFRPCMDVSDPQPSTSCADVSDPRIRASRADVLDPQPSTSRADVSDPQPSTSHADVWTLNQAPRAPTSRTLNQAPRAWMKYSRELAVQFRLTWSRATYR